MRRLLLAALTLALCGLGSYAQKVETVFTDGSVDRRDTKGLRRELEIGDRLGTGEEVITGRNGKAELRLLSGNATLKVSPNSVLLLGEKNVGGETRPVLQTLAGSVAMKFGAMTGKEPLIGTAACVGAIRGTEVEVYAAMDGSALVAVLSGAVSLESGGSSVELAANEAVQVETGKAPGQKFAWIGKELDFSAWNQGKLETFLADPLSPVQDLETQLLQYKTSMDELLAQLAQQTALYDEAYAELKGLVEAKDEAGAEALRQSKVFPLMHARGTLILDIRYYALSALSLRRFALGAMYAEMKSRHMLDPETGAYGSFMAVYRRVVREFETDFVPQLVEADI